MGTLEVRPSDLLGPEVRGNHLCNYRLVECNVVDVCK